MKKNKLPLRTRLGATVMICSAMSSSHALDTATIIASALSPDCLGYRVSGIC